MTTLYIVEGYPDDPFYGNILLYHGHDENKARNSNDWAGDGGQGFRVHIYADDGYRTFEGPREFHRPGDPELTPEGKAWIVKLDATGDEKC